ncbi:MAG: phosphotransferase [Caldilineaceae bacterium]
MQTQPDSHAYAHAYDHYRDLLATLATDEIPLDVLREVGKQCGWWQPCRTWQRTYGRFHLGATPLVTLIYETIDAPQEICVIHVQQTFPAIFTPGQALFRRNRVGWLSLTRFPADPHLPTLRSVLARPYHAKVVRYRPGKRCTIRCPAPAGDAPIAPMFDLPCFAKVFADDEGAAIHHESLALWVASQTGVIGFAVARPLAWQGELRTLWQGVVPGAPIMTRLLSAEGPALAERLGRAAASLTQSGLQPQQVTDGRKQQKRSVKYAERLRAFFPALAPALDFLLEKLAVVHAERDQTRLRPIHGAPHAHQWLDDGERLGLVDFDGFALGDPELDAATFLAEMEFEDWETVPVAAINHRFQTGYEAVAGPLEPRLLNAYRAHKRLSKALRNAYAVRADNDMRVERALGQAIIAALQT